MIPTIVPIIIERAKLKHCLEEECEAEPGLSNKAVVVHKAILSLLSAFEAADRIQIHNLPGKKSNLDTKTYI